MDEVYALAADMGGMGFISSHDAQIIHNNTLINFHTSSACVYPVFKQTDTDVVPLKEEDAYAAMPEDAYGWEKLLIERLCLYYREDYQFETRIVRFHNIFGPAGTWEGGREKAPAALCRKVAMAKLTGNPEVEILGDGKQTRSFCHIDDCVVGIHKLMRSDYAEPLNLGQDRLLSIDELADMIADIAGIKIVHKHVEGPQGVRGRNSDNTRLYEVSGWEPEILLKTGLAKTYAWIEEQVQRKMAPSATSWIIVLNLRDVLCFVKRQIHGFWGKRADNRQYEYKCASNRYFEAQEGRLWNNGTNDLRAHKH